MTNKRKHEGLDHGNGLSPEKKYTVMAPLQVDVDCVGDNLEDPNAVEEAVDDPLSIAGDDPLSIAGDDPLSIAGDDPLYTVVDDPLSTMRTETGGEPEPPPKKKRKLKYDDCLNMMVLQCEWNMCSSMFNKMEYFSSHVIEHLDSECRTASEDGFLCIWRECDYVCDSKDELDRHVFFHAFHTKLKAIGKITMNHFDTGECVIDSSGRNLIPEIPEAFQCLWGDCSLRFPSAQEFYWHVQSQVVSEDPNEQKQFKCYWQGCTSVFKTLLKLIDHSRSHTQEKRVGCPNCGGIYVNNTKFRDHYLRQIPLNLQKFQCSHCSTKFASERLLRDHVRRHINHFRCTDCDMTCPTRSTLMVHILYKHSDEKSHKCSQCDKCFKTAMDLNRHMSVHSELPAYICPVSDCEFSCRAQSTLNHHIKVKHTGLCKTHYACHICNQKYSLGIFLTKHLTKVHNFHWPSGHTRFRYKREEDGFYRLQTIRYESIELMHEGDENNQEEEMVDSPDTMSAPPTPASSHAGSSSIPYDQPLSQKDCCKKENLMHQMDNGPILKPPSSPKHDQKEIILPSEY